MTRCALVRTCGIHNCVRLLLNQMASQQSVDWSKVHAVKDKYCATLLQKPHVNFVGVSLKKIGGQPTDIPTIQVAVKKKLPLAELSDEEKIPAFLDGIATDVIEGDLNLVKLGDVLNRQLEEEPSHG